MAKKSTTSTPASAKSSAKPESAKPETTMAGKSKLSIQVAGDDGSLFWTTLQPAYRQYNLAIQATHSGAEALLRWAKLGPGLQRRQPLKFSEFKKLFIDEVDRQYLAGKKTIDDLGKAALAEYESVLKTGKFPNGVDLAELRRKKRDAVKVRNREDQLGDERIRRCRDNLLLELSKRPDMAKHATLPRKQLLVAIATEFSLADFPDKISRAGSGGKRHSVSSDALTFGKK